ncbi:hypothetical protein BDN70DRAFT_900399 [Pholiota conissans]|uniref:Uncharacterized protein n=1 Tax=Pholiota conissans TaxID=109636 RepID=A0A9P5YMQ6_9AGAR|nr:hypothetical protein BDN70DRAFT_900399 [Pholiota conissans]
MHRRRLLRMPLDWGEDSSLLESPVKERFNALHRPTKAAQFFKDVGVSHDTQQAKIVEDFGFANTRAVDATLHTEPIEMDNNTEQAETSPETPSAYTTSESSLNEKKFDMYVQDEDELVETQTSTSPIEETETFVNEEQLETYDPLEDLVEMQESVSPSEWTQEAETPNEEEQFEIFDAEELEETHVSPLSSVYPAKPRRINSNPIEIPLWMREQYMSRANGGLYRF